MTKFAVQECKEGRNVGQSQTIFANSEFEAAKAIVVGYDLRQEGKLGELRARVRPTSAGSRAAGSGDQRRHEMSVGRGCELGFEGRGKMMVGGCHGPSLA